ncbi:MAG: EamA family transporter [Bacillota bacterium]|nr:EamA family transporter [Bacillota bacterium]
MKNKPYYMIATGATLWGLMGLFVQPFYNWGFSASELVAIRALSAFIIAVSYLVIFRRDLLKIRVGDIGLFIGTGVLSIAFFNWCYFTSIQSLSLSVSAALLYTGPAFVTLLSRIFFAEKLTMGKVSALVLTCIGCSLVVGFLPNMQTSASGYYLLIGLGAGFGYALYSIFGKIASNRYHPLTIITYTFLFASVAMVPMSSLWEKASLFTQPVVLLTSLSIGLIPTVFAYLLYTYGLAMIESSLASIAATIEPVVAVITGMVFLGDILTPWQGAGIILILLAVTLVQRS